MPDQTKQSKPMTSVEVLESIKALLPAEFDTQDPLSQLDLLVKAANETLKPEGDWVLVNGNLTLIQLLENNG